MGYARTCASLTLSRMRAIILVALAGVVLAAGGLLWARVHPAPQTALVEEAPVPTRTPEPTLVVDVTGAVANPGVYRLPAGSRVIDALLAAGGMTGEADLLALNKATPLRDGARIYVPRPGEPIPAGTFGSEAERKLDLNHASAAELQTLPGVGATTAARIVRSRGAKPFTKIEELQTRGLVTPRVFSDLRDLVTV